MVQANGSSLNQHYDHRGERSLKGPEFTDFAALRVEGGYGSFALTY